MHMLVFALLFPVYTTLSRAAGPRQQETAHIRVVFFIFTKILMDKDSALGDPICGPPPPPPESPKLNENPKLNGFL